MAKNQGSMLPNNSTPTTPKSETECDVTDDQENAHLEVEETETNVENSDEKSTGKFFQKFKSLKNSWFLSTDSSHFIFEINVGKSRIRHTTTLKMN